MTKNINRINDNIKHILISISEMTLRIINYCEKWKNFKMIRSTYIFCFGHCSFGEKKCFLTWCLYVLKPSDIFRKSGRLLQIISAVYERLFRWWLVFCKVYFNFSKILSYFTQMSTHNRNGDVLKGYKLVY